MLSVTGEKRADLEVCPTRETYCRAPEILPSPQATSDEITRNPFQFSSSCMFLFANLLHLLTYSHALQPPGLRLHLACGPGGPTAADGHRLPTGSGFVADIEPLGSCQILAPRYSIAMKNSSCGSMTAAQRLAVLLLASMSTSIECYKGKYI